MTGLTTHVLDTALGKPAQGLRIQLMRMTGEEAELIKTVWGNGYLFAAEVTSQLT